MWGVQGFCWAQKQVLHGWKELSALWKPKSRIVGVTSGWIAAGTVVEKGQRLKLGQAVHCSRGGDGFSNWNLMSSRQVSWTITQKRDFCGVCSAKKKGKKAGKKKKGSLMDVPMEAEGDPWFSGTSIMWLLMLAENHKRATGKSLLEDAEIADIAQDIWEAPFCVLLNNGGSGEPLLCTYANKACLECLDVEWSDLINKPDSELPEPIVPMIGTLTEDLKGADGGAIEEYSIKVKDFEINGATLYTLSSPIDKSLGQVLIFSTWTYDDGTVGGSGITNPNKVPNAEDIAKAEALVSEQGQVVRMLKEEKGLTNKDEEVKTAVAVLLERKENLALLQKRMEEALPSD